MLTIEQRRKADRKRRERWHKRKLAQGCRQIQLMLTPEAQKVLEYKKSLTGEPYVQIIHRAILELDNGLSVTSSESKAQLKTIKTNTIQTKDLVKTKPRSKISDIKKANQQDQLKLF